MPTRENGPAARSFAADAHDCIMVRIKRSYRIQVCGARSAPNGELPSDPPQTGNRQTPERSKKPLSLGSSSLRVLWGQGAAKHKRRYAASRQALIAFRSLDPLRALREPDRRRRDEERLSAPNKEPATNQKHDLTGKAPYKFESGFLQRGVGCGPDFRGRRIDS
jgi:hypothetical protein